MTRVPYVPPAIDRMTPEERAIFVRMLAAAALKRALAALDKAEAEAADPSEKTAGER